MAAAGTVSRTRLLLLTKGVLLVYLAHMPFGLIALRAPASTVQATGVREAAMRHAKSVFELTQAVSGELVRLCAVLTVSQG